MVPCHDAPSADSPKIEGIIVGNRPLRAVEIRRNPATIAFIIFFTYVIMGWRSRDQVGLRGV